MLYVKYGKNQLHAFREVLLKMLMDGQRISLYYKLNMSLTGSDELKTKWPPWERIKIIGIQAHVFQQFQYQILYSVQTKLFELCSMYLETVSVMN